MKNKILSIGKFLLKIFWFVAERVFVFGLAGFFIASILGSVVFYQRVVLPQESDDSTSKSLFQIDENSYQKFLDFQLKRKEIFNSVGVQSYRDIFK